MAAPIRSAGNSESVSVRELYTLLDDRFGAVNNSIQRLESRIDSLVSDRLSHVERDVATIQGKLMIVPILISIAMGVFSFIINATILHK